MSKEIEIGAAFGSPFEVLAATKVLPFVVIGRCPAVFYEKRSLLTRSSNKPPAEAAIIQLAVSSDNTSATCAICPSINSANIGSERQRAATSSAMGKSPALYPSDE